MPTPPLRYRFGDFEFREGTGELWRSGRATPLPEQAGKVLLALLRAPGEVVTRAALRQLLWPDRIAGDFEGGLHAAVRKLRRALDDDGTEPRVIGTLPRRGYRLLVPVAAGEDHPDPSPGGPGDRAGRFRQAARRPLLALLGALLAVLGAGALLWRPWPRSAVTLELPRGARLVLLHIPAGAFAMRFDTGYKPTELVHRVTLSHDFWLGRTEVTQAQWAAVMGNNPAFFQGDDRPVEQVSWDDCQAFLVRLNQLQHKLVFRLPTEAEWEYAARSGRLTSMFEPGEAFEWNFTNSLDQTRPVAGKRPNPWGLYDMLGNVWEWCADGFAPYLPYPQVDPVGPDNGLRTVRGGSWLSPGARHVAWKRYGRATLRYGYPPEYAAFDLGFRLAAEPKSGSPVPLRK